MASVSPIDLHYIDWIGWGDAFVHVCAARRRKMAARLEEGETRLEWIIILFTCCTTIKDPSFALETCILRKSLICSAHAKTSYTSHCLFFSLFNDTKYYTYFEIFLSKLKHLNIDLLFLPPWYNHPNKRTALSRLQWAIYLLISLICSIPQPTAQNVPKGKSFTLKELQVCN